MDVDRMWGGQDIAEGHGNIGLALLDQHGGRGAEDLAGGQLGDVGEGSDDVAEVIAGSRVDVGRVRGVFRFLAPRQWGAHRYKHHQYRHRNSQSRPSPRPCHRSEPPLLTRHVADDARFRSVTMESIDRVFRAYQFYQLTHDAVRRTRWSADLSGAVTAIRDPPHAAYSMIAVRTSCELHDDPVHS